MVSSLAMDSACALELLAPAFPVLFIPIASVANVGKNISWLAASASRAAIHNSFVRSSNLADITAKSGSQSMVASLLGTSLGIFVSTQLGSEWGLHTLGAFGGLSAIHLTFTYLSLNVVELPVLNAQRLNLLLDAFIEHKRGGVGGGVDGGDGGMVAVGLLVAGALAAQVAVVSPARMLSQGWSVTFRSGRSSH